MQWFVSSETIWAYGNDCLDIVGGFMRNSVLEIGTRDGVVLF